MTVALLALVIAGVALTLLARWRGGQALALVAKPAASTGFVALALHQGALDTTFGTAVLVALCLCWLGDVLLVARALPMLAGGLVAFLLGHLALGVAFVRLGLHPPALAIASVVMTALAVAGLRWLWPHVKGHMRAAVAAYVVVISLMTTFAAGAAVQAEQPVLLLAAVCFSVSDLAVARERFIRASIVNPLWGLPLYYLAVVLLALSVAPPPT